MRQDLVARLLAQYADYQAVVSRQAEAEDALMQAAADAAHTEGRGLSALLAERATHPSLAPHDAAIRAAAAELQEISDAMTFADPLVWMGYKAAAYRGTPQEIADVGAFRRHCAPEGYICTKRYRFLRAALVARGVDVDDAAVFPAEMTLEAFAAHPEIIALAEDPAFRAAWKEREYHRDGERVAKWENA